mmetsp:Transcript_143391/g.260827  ORF Transcript_143391/g.260827 Transcript_143391/m.260827 type:complete len:197 (+) Transcript_143391:79-669(+)
MSDATPPTTPPVTPPAKSRDVFSPPPRPVATTSDLMKAFRSNSEEWVRSELLDNPGAAARPMWQDNLELPLCAAVGLKCSPGIIKQLLDNQADVNAVGRRRQTPLTICRNNMKFLEFQNMIFGDVDKDGGKSAAISDALLVEEMLMEAQVKTGVVEGPSGDEEAACPGGAAPFPFPSFTLKGDCAIYRDFQNIFGS